MNDIQLKKLAALISLDNLDSLDTLSPAPSTMKIFLFTPEDYYLSKDQFDTVKTIIQPNESLYVAQLGYVQHSISKLTEVYSFKQPLDFQKYKEIWLDTLSFVFSDSCEWLIVVDESLNGGEGIFVGNDVRAAQFWKQYKNANRDILKFIELCIGEHKKRNVPLKHMFNILNICR